jgi:hypothetical protein
MVTQIVAQVDFMLQYCRAVFLGVGRRGGVMAMFRNSLIFDHRTKLIRVRNFLATQKKGHS